MIKTYNKEINKLPGKWPGWITVINECSSLASETRVRPFSMWDGRDITYCKKTTRFMTPDSYEHDGAEIWERYVGKMRKDIKSTLMSQFLWLGFTIKV